MDIKQIGPYAVCRWLITGTETIIHAVYEPTEFGAADEHGHGTVISRKVAERVEWLGRVGTRRLPTVSQQLPVDERTAVELILRSAQYEHAYTLIMEAYPETSYKGVRANGEIVISPLAIRAQVMS